MGWCSPGEKALQSILENEDYSYSTDTVSKSPERLLEALRTLH